MARKLTQIIEGLSGLLLILFFIIEFAFSKEGGVQGLLFPKKYWSKQVRLLEESVQVCTVGVKQCNDELREKESNIESEIKETYDIMVSKGMSKGQAMELATQVHMNVLDAEKKLLENEIGKLRKKLKEKEFELERARKKLREANR